MRILLVTLAIIFTIMTLLPLSKAEYWWVRIFDYPRVQLATVSIIVISLLIIYRYTSPWIIVLMVVLGLATIYQAFLIYPYTPFAKVQTVKSKNTDKSIKLRVFVNNVRMYNQHYDSVLSAIKEADPDVILLMETNRDWLNHVKELEKDFPYTLHEPLENTYGILFFSKFKLHEARINYLVEKHVPSIFCKIELKSGDTIDIYGLHPAPPKPNQDTEERDAEIVTVGKQVKKSGRPSLVLGDLNDVAWSHTTRLFQRISGMSDPRVGRGFFNTYNAFIPVFRFPLDHIFHTPQFRLVHLERIDAVGSDHFPMLAELSYEPERKNVQEIPKPDSDDHEEADEKIQQVK